MLRSRYVSALGGQVKNPIRRLGLEKLRVMRGVRGGLSVSHVDPFSPIQNNFPRIR